MLIGSVGSLIDNIIKIAISRQRPPSDLVHILIPALGYSYPSGHAGRFPARSRVVGLRTVPARTLAALAEWRCHSRRRAA